MSRHSTNLKADWIAPDRLDRSRPRPVTLTGGGKAMLALAIVLLQGGVIAAVGLGAIARRDAEEARLFREEGMITDAVVTRRWQTRGENRHYWVAYRFILGDSSYEGESKIGRAMWRRVSIGSPIPVRYARNSPGLNHPRGSGEKGMPLWLPYVVAAVLAVCAVLVPLPILNQRRLLSSGRVAPGLVTAHSKEQHGTHGAKLGKKFHFEFPLLSGAVGKGEGGPSKNTPAIGSTICVLYDPENPRKNAVYPLSLVRPS